MQHGDPVAGEAGDVEGQDAADAVHQHRGDQAGVIDLAAQHPVGNDEPLPYRVDRRILRRQMKQLFDRANFGCGAAAVELRPLAAPTGRVATAQNSAMFCGVT
jgi:hypothetical protein